MKICIYGYLIAFAKSIIPKVSLEGSGSRWTKNNIKK